MSRSNWNNKGMYAESGTQMVGQVVATESKATSIANQESREAVFFRGAAQQFPFFQSVRGNGFCYGNAVIGAFLMKCVEDGAAGAEKYQQFLANIRELGIDAGRMPREIAIHQQVFDFMNDDTAKQIIKDIFVESALKQSAVTIKSLSSELPAEEKAKLTAIVEDIKRDVKSSGRAMQKNGEYLKQGDKVLGQEEFGEYHHITFNLPNLYDLLYVSEKGTLDTMDQGAAEAIISAIVPIPHTVVTPGYDPREWLYQDYNRIFITRVAGAHYNILYGNGNMPNLAAAFRGEVIQQESSKSSAGVPVPAPLPVPVAARAPAASRSSAAGGGSVKEGAPPKQLVRKEQKWCIEKIPGVLIKGVSSVRRPLKDGILLQRVILESPEESKAVAEITAYLMRAIGKSDFYMLEDSTFLFGKIGECGIECAIEKDGWLPENYQDVFRFLELNPNLGKQIIEKGVVTTSLFREAGQREERQSPMIVKRNGSTVAYEITYPKEEYVHLTSAFYRDLGIDNPSELASAEAVAVAVEEAKELRLKREREQERKAEELRLKQEQEREDEELARQIREEEFIEPLPVRKFQAQARPPVQVRVENFRPNGGIPVPEDFRASAGGGIAREGSAGAQVGSWCSAANKALPRGTVLTPVLKLENRVNTVRSANERQVLEQQKLKYPLVQDVMIAGERGRDAAAIVAILMMCAGNGWYQNFKKELETYGYKELPDEINTYQDVYNFASDSKRLMTLVSTFKDMGGWYEYARTKNDAGKLDIKFYDDREYLRGAANKGVRIVGSDDGQGWKILYPSTDRVLVANFEEVTKAEVVASSPSSSSAQGERRHAVKESYDLEWNIMMQKRAEDEKLAEDQRKAQQAAEDEILARRLEAEYQREAREANQRASAQRANQRVVLAEVEVPRAPQRQVNAIPVDESASLDGVIVLDRLPLAQGARGAGLNNDHAARADAPPSGIVARVGRIFGLGRNPALQPNPAPRPMGQQQLQGGHQQREGGGIRGRVVDLVSRFSSRGGR